MVDDFDPVAARKDLKPEAFELLRKPLIQSLLYDINLLPEQITTGKHWFYMLSVIHHMKQAMEASRSGGWRVVEVFCDCGRTIRVDAQPPQANGGEG